MKRRTLLATVVGLVVSAASAVAAEKPATKPAERRVFYIISPTAGEWGALIKHAAESVNRLPSTDRFAVGVMAGKRLVMLPGGLLPASDQSKDAAWAWLQKAEPVTGKGELLDDGEDLTAALVAVSRTVPTDIVFVSSGKVAGDAEPETILEPFRRATAKTPFRVHTSLAFYDPRQSTHGPAALIELARMTGGTCHDQRGEPVDFRKVARYVKPGTTQPRSTGEPGIGPRR